MKDNSVFLSIVTEFGLLDEDLLYKGEEHVFANRIGSLESDWRGKKTFADLTMCKRKLDWLTKAKKVSAENKDGIHLFLFSQSTHLDWMQYSLKYCKALYFFDKPYILVEFQGVSKGIPLVYHLKSRDGVQCRRHFLNRVLISDF